MIRTQSFSEPMPLDGELHKGFSGFFSLPDLGGTGWLEWAGVGVSLLTCGRVGLTGVCLFLSLRSVRFW